MADPIKAAKGIFGQFLAKADPASMPDYDPNAKAAQAQAAGRKGARKGGLARAKNLSSKKRAEIARKAAKARWRKKIQDRFSVPS
jgi:uncharacterized protein YaiL (DUF2058 family)